MHYTNVKGILSAQNNMNLYRGCTHGCIYCDSRSTCYQMTHAFEDIEVKSNAINLLEQKLRNKRTKCMLSTGAMTDPYMPIETTEQSTRKALILAERYGFGFTVHTKSSRILRDIELLKRINQQTKCVVQMTLTTFDEILCKQLEPNVSSTKERVATLKQLHASGIPTIVWLSPILPFINDTEENIIGILNYCIAAQVKGIICFNMGVTMRSGNREYFYDQLTSINPNLKQKYISTFGNRYELTSPHNEKLMRIFHETCSRNNIMHNPKEIFNYLKTFEQKQNIQLNLFEELS